MSASMRTRLLALSCLLACAMAQSMPWDFADIGTGVPMAANCTPSGSGMPAQWIEMTDVRPPGLRAVTTPIPCRPAASPASPPTALTLHDA